MLYAERLQAEKERDLLIERKNELTLEKNFLERDLENHRLTLEKTFLQMAELQSEIALCTE